MNGAIRKHCWRRQPVKILALHLWLLATACTGDASQAPDPAAGGGADGAGPNGGGEAAAGSSPPLATEMSQFARNVWLPTLRVQCLGCHVPGGLAQQSGSTFMLLDPTRPTYLAQNIQAVRTAGAVLQGGGSWLLGKATGSLSHGGGKVLDPASDAYAKLVAYLADTDLAQVGDPQLGAAQLAQVRQLGDGDVLQRAAMHLASRQPTANEAQLAAAGKLDQALGLILSGQDFGDFVLHAFDDIFLGAVRNVNNQGLDTYSYSDQLYPPGKPRNYGTLPNGDPFYNGYQIYWYETDPAVANEPRLASLNNHDITNFALPTMGLQRAKYLATNGGDWREMLTGKSLLMNPWSARSFSTDFNYDLFAETAWTNPYDPNEYRPVTMTDRPNWPTVGTISDAMFLNTFSTTATNRQRKRVATLYRLFMGFDPLILGQRPANLNQILQAAAQDPTAPVPTMANPACTSCHAVLDPAAAALAPYTDGVVFYPPDAGYGPAPLFPAGFEGAAMPASAQGNPAMWLGEKMAADPRFARGAVTFWFNLITGLAPLGDPGGNITDIDAFLAGQRFFDAHITSVTQAFVASGYNIQVAIKGILTGPYYRAVDLAPGLSAGDKAVLDTLISTRWVGPRRLNGKLLAATGQTLRGSTDYDGWGGSDQTLIRSYLSLLDGNFAGSKVTQPTNNPSGVMVRVTTATASQVACQLVAKTFAAPAATRVVFAGVEPSDTPDTPAGIARIEAAIAGLYSRLLGSDAAAGASLEADHADALALFTTVLANSRQAHDISLPANCQSSSLTQDPTYTIKAWMAVVALALSDPRVVLE